MRKNKLLVISVLIALCAALVILPVSAATNLCLGASILGADTAESGIYYNDAEHDFCQTVNAGAEAPSFLIDDDAGYATKWCATDSGDHADEPHWIVIDFGSEKTFDSLQLVKASEGERDFGSTNLDASAYTFWASNDKTNWTKFCEETENHDPIYKKTFDAVTARYVKLTIERAEESLENVATVRLYDLAIYEAAAAAAPAAEAPAETPAAETKDEPVAVEETTAPAPAPQQTTSVPPTGDATIIFVVLAVAALAAGAVTLKVKKDRA